MTAATPAPQPPRKHAHPVRWDLLAGFLAIVAVLACSIYLQFVGSDMRAVFAVTTTAFFLAGLARSRGGAANLWIKAVIVSCPGLLGTAALLMNDGFQRWLVPLTLAVAAILSTALGVHARRTGVRWQAWGAVAAFVAVMPVVVLAAVPRLVTYASVSRATRQAPEFTLTAPDGRTLRSAELRGHVVVLAYFASWCLPCNWELPELQATYDRYAADPRVVFLAVDAGGEGETPAKARAFMKRRELRLPWAFDEGPARQAFGVEALPTLILLDGSGQVRFVHHGYDASEHVAQLTSNNIEALLKEASSRN